MDYLVFLQLLGSPRRLAATTTRVATQSASAAPPATILRSWTPKLLGMFQKPFMIHDSNSVQPLGNKRVSVLVLRWLLDAG
jgi:hypothetical protein